MQKLQYLSHFPFLIGIFEKSVASYSEYFSVLPQNVYRVHLQIVSKNRKEKLKNQEKSTYQKKYFLPFLIGILEQF